MGVKNRALQSVHQTVVQKHHCRLEVLDAGGGLIGVVVVASWHWRVWSANAA